MLEVLGPGVDFNIETLSIEIVVIEKVSDFNSGFVCSYISWFDGVSKDWIYC